MRHRRHDHPSDVVLHRLIDGGAAAGWSQARLAAHLQQCHACALRLRYARAARTALRGAAADAPTPEAPRDLLERILRDLRAGGDS